MFCPRIERSLRPRRRQILAPMLGRPGDAHGTGCLDRLLQAPGTFFAVVMQPTFQIYQAPCGGAADQIPGQHGSLAQALGVVASGGFTPQQIRTAYAINQIEFGATKGDGTGETIAIVDAYDDPDLVDSTSANFTNSDLAQFDKLFGLPDPPSFEKLGQNGTANLPGADPDRRMGSGGSP